MLALRLYGPQDIRLEEVPVPQINDDEILLKTDSAAVCGTDVRMWQNGQTGVDAEHPLILGHEFAGTIVKVGKNVPFYKEGMQVAMQPNIGCGICDRCVDGKFHLCDEYRAFGINMDGAFAEYVKIPADAVTRGNLMVLPKGVSPAEAAVTEPLSCAYNGFTKCFVHPGEYAMVVGAGPIGFCHAMLLHMAGAAVLMNDISAERLEAVKKKLPFVETYCGDDLAGFVKKWTNGRGLDIAITACPVPAVQASVLPMMNYGGRVNYFGGIPAAKQPVAIDTNLIHYRELYVTGSTRSSISQFRKTLEFVSLGLLNVNEMITHRYQLKDVLTAFENARQAKGIKHVIEF
ncbi:MAG: alcohol dehydrogenase catalytic domain-containing protein [Oscillospiraceae bacterium]|nr:alcohol dehydrogenase catalytic domain-containing protein [Oscillospiraceae bacterium]